MKRRTMVWALAAAFICSMGLASAWAGQAASVTGTVIGGYAIQTDDGEMYEIGDTEKGNELADHDGERATVTGAVEGDEYGKTILVTGFSIVSAGPDDEPYQSETYVEEEEEVQEPSEDTSSSQPQGLTLIPRGREPAGPVMRIHPIQAQAARLFSPGGFLLQESIPGKMHLADFQGRVKTLRHRLFPYQPPGVGFL